MHRIQLLISPIMRGEASVDVLLIISFRDGLCAFLAGCFRMGFTLGMFLLGVGVNRLQRDWMSVQNLFSLMEEM